MREVSRTDPDTVIRDAAVQVGRITITGIRFKDNYARLEVSASLV